MTNESIDIHLWRTKKLLKVLELYAQEEFGERCPDHEPDCPVCRMWGYVDKIREHVS